jgi:hypothetical protein
MAGLDRSGGPGGRRYTIRPPASDFWQVGLVPAPIATLLEPSALAAVRERITWLPHPGPWRYLADPFGVRRRDATHVFVEAFDYRTKHAVIEHHEFSPDLVWRSKRTALARPFHLSYPYLVEDAGEIFMIPESHQANEIALYRAREFPGGWVRESALLTGVPGAEPSLLRHEGRWWMFFTLVGPMARDMRELHVAHAETLTGPWRLHPQNPIIDSRAGARPGGTPFVASDGKVTLPVQDCSLTYGGAIRFLRFHRLTPDRISVERLEPRLTGDLVSSTHQEGWHTLAECGDLTLIDTKRIVRTWARCVVNLQCRVARLGFIRAGG